MASFDTAVLLLIFNRPETTQVVFNAIRQIKPSRLFIAADGPRFHNVDDQTNCEQARRVTEQIDWPCEVYRLFHKINLGCGKAPAAGISWFFEHVEEGIILEDDIHPSPDFFWFCNALLQRYRHDARVMEIGGVNLIANACRGDGDDYYFSNHNHTWGWATWRRAWQYFDFTMKHYRSELVQRFLEVDFNSEYEYDYFKNLFDATYESNHAITWWDYQWEFARRINSGLSIVPMKNLVTNIGLGKNGTHTLDANGVGSDLQWSALTFPLKHPDLIMADRQKDAYYFKQIFSTRASRLKFAFAKLIPDLLKGGRTIHGALKSQLLQTKS